MLSIGSRPSADTARGNAMSPEISMLTEQEEGEENEAVLETSGTESFSPLPKHDTEQSSVCDNQTERASLSISANPSPTPPVSPSSSDQVAILTSQSNSTTITRSSSDQTIQQSCIIGEDTASTSIPVSVSSASDGQSTEEQGTNKNDRAPSSHGNEAAEQQQGSEGPSPAHGSKTDQPKVSTREQGSKCNRAPSPGQMSVTDQPTQKQGSKGDRASSPQGNGTDQLKMLTVASRPNGDKRETSPARSEQSDYEKITMEAAALSREKWMQNEGNLE